MTKVSIDRALAKAKSHLRQGKIREAQELYRSVLEQFPNNPRAIRGLELAGKANATASGPTQAQVNELMSRFHQGRFEKALELGTNLAEQFPSIALFPNLLGAVNANLGRSNDAINCFKRAVELQPADAGIHGNLGAALIGADRIAEGIESLSRSLQIMPNNPEAHNNLGNALLRQKNYDTALVHVRRAIELNQKHPDAHYNLGRALEAKGELDMALGSYVTATSLAPNHDDAWWSLAHILPSVSPLPYRDETSEILCQLLDKQNLFPPSPTVLVVMQFLTGHPTISHLLGQLESCGQVKMDASTLSSLCSIPLLGRILLLYPLPDLRFESVLTELRRFLLVSASDGTLTTEAASFHCALAENCRINEYIFHETEEETELVRTLEEELTQAADQGESLSIAKLSSLASYRPLGSYSWLHRSLLPSELAMLVKSHIDDPVVERELAAKIPTIQSIDDRVSKAVREQYEENPYPLWVAVDIPLHTLSIPNYLEDIGVEADFSTTSPSTAPEVLVAGCGTGMHAVTVATRYKDCRLLAVDLSRSSLGYAARKSQELGITNIEFAQADILNLGCLDRQFDLIECVGVLHHMAEPLAGWRVLLDLLKPGGLMKIGLYSALARRNITRARSVIAELKLDGTAESIKTFRRLVLNSHVLEEGNIQDLSKFLDFFSMSELRDLIFHVQEHQFTVPELTAAISECELEFLGFQLFDLRQKHFIDENFPATGSQLSLEDWHSFEENHPDTFAGMYQMWLQKSA